MSQQNGDTDSERILLHLLELMDKAYIKKGESLTAKERFDVLDRMVVAASPDNKLNLLIYDERVLSTIAGDYDRCRFSSWVDGKSQ